MSCWLSPRGGLPGKFSKRAAAGDGSKVCLAEVLQGGINQAVKRGLLFLPGSGMVMFRPIRTPLLFCRKFFDTRHYGLAVSKVYFSEASRLFDPDFGVFEFAAVFEGL